MIYSLVSSMLGWLPAPLVALCVGVVAIFFLGVLLRLIAFIFDVIPFL